MPARNAPGAPAVLAATLLSALVVWALPAGAQESEEEAVIAVVQGLFDAMAARDGETIAALLTEDARLVSVRPGPDGERIVGSQDGSAFVEAIAGGEADLLERMWEPRVRVQGDIATLWAPYDLWVDGERSHCGIDAFQLLRAADGWRIAHVAYTVQRQGCAESPLGPPE